MHNTLTVYFRYMHRRTIIDLYRSTVYRENNNYPDHALDPLLINFHCSYIGLPPLKLSDHACMLCVCGRGQWSPYMSDRTESEFLFACCVNIGDFRPNNCLGMDSAECTQRRSNRRGAAQVISL